VPASSASTATSRRDQLTDYVVIRGLDPLPHLRVLDTARVLPLLRKLGDR